MLKKDSKWILNWQKEFEQQPKIYYTFSSKIHELTGHYYDSKEAAQYEVDWAKNRNEHLQIFSVHIHNTILSKDRWGKTE